MKTIQITSNNNTIKEVIRGFTWQVFLDSFVISQDLLLAHS